MCQFFAILTSLFTVWAVGCGAVASCLAVSFQLNSNVTKLGKAKPNWTKLELGGTKAKLCHAAMMNRSKEK